MSRWQKRLLLPVILLGFVAAGCDGELKFVFKQYPETPVVAAPPAGLSSSQLAAIIAAIR